jgi:serine/threonine-protein kinase
MVTGTKPFLEDEKKSALHKIRLDKHTGARSLNTEIPRELSNIIDKCLEKQPRDRWRSAQHMVMALERFLAKHVEMNHHARLVLFIKAQGVITELEAEEYLNPAALGAGAGALQQPNLAARNIVRAGVVAHGIMLGVLVLFLGLSHVAPLGATPSGADQLRKEAMRGYIRVDAHPWARIFVDGEQVGTTPIADPLALKDGAHTIRLEHDWYQPIDRKIQLSAGSAADATPVVVDFERQGVLRPGKTKPAEGR